MLAHSRLNVVIRDLRDLLEGFITAKIAGNSTKNANEEKVMVFIIITLTFNYVSYARDCVGNHCWNLLLVVSLLTL